MCFVGVGACASCWVYNCIDVVREVMTTWLIMFRIACCCGVSWLGGGGGLYGRDVAGGGSGLSIDSAGDVGVWVSGEGSG